MFHAAARRCVAVDAADLALRRKIFAAFAAVGSPPALDEDLTSLAEQHVIALDDDGRVWMAHPFAAHREGARVESGGRVWWGNCAWDGLGIVHALVRQTKRPRQRATREYEWSVDHRIGGKRTTRARA